MVKECDQAGMKQCGKQCLLAKKKVEVGRKGREGRARGVPRVGSSAIHLWLESIWGLYSMYIKNKDPATPWEVIYQDGDFNEKLHLMQDKGFLP